mgnify:CR=1
MTRIIFSLAVLFLLASSIAQAQSETKVPCGSPDPAGHSWRNMLIPEVQQITDRIVQLRQEYECERAKNERNLLARQDSSAISHVEEISRHVTDQVRYEFNDHNKTHRTFAPDCNGPFCGNLTEKDIADMMYCRFGQSIKNCPRQEFLRKHSP